MHLRTKRLALISSGIAATAVLIDALVLEHLLFSVKTFSIGNNKGDDSPVRILHLTDLHFRKDLALKFRILAKRINKISPDMIFLSGDSIDQNGEIRPLEKFLRLLDSQIPKVAILGNHEYEAGIDIDELRRSYNKTNTTLLINESKSWNIRGKRIMVTGMDDLIEGEENFMKAVENVGKENHHFVLIHSPLHQEKIKEHISQINASRPENEKLNIYAFFAGHNHGGQVKLGKFVPHLPEESGDYIEGWYNEEKPYLYLSRGFGTSKIPVRFWSRSEITLFEYQ